MPSTALPRLVRAWLLISLLSCLPSLAFAQCVSLTTLGSAVTQNFDTLSNTAGSTTNNLTITGWFLTESGGGARDNEQYGVDTGASTTGDMYSYGAAAATDRALGQLRSGTLIPLFGACFTNNTGSTLASLAVAYTGEEWRLGTAARTDTLAFEYSTTATDLVTGAWTGVTALNFVTPDTATAGAKNGNAAADRTALASTISGLSIANGASFWIRWNDTDASGADDGLAVDDFSLTPQAPIALPNLSINDVILNEGNAGTTSFTFTVSLSAPAGPGGVTFDIATADGTAVAPGDYVTKSLTSQTIPAGSSTYSFTVLANGDTTPETNETFFVNVTAATGATVTDGQGQGTLVNDDAAPNLTINDVSLNEGNAGTTTFTFIASLSAPAPAGGVTFDIATANGTAIAPGDYTASSLTGQTIPAGSSTYTFSVLVNGDITPESDETFVVTITNATNAIVTDGQGQGNIVNDDLSRIHDVQGNGASTPIPGATVTVQGIVIGNFQGAGRLQGFFLQEADANADADPATSEGIFVSCGSCATPVAEGQVVRATGVVSESNNLTQISATTAGAVVVTNAGNNLAQVTPTTIDLPVVGAIDDFYESRESMRVTFVDTLAVSDYFEMARYGQLVLMEGGRPRAFTEFATPSVAGYTAYLDNLARRRVLLDDDNNAQESFLTQPNGMQSVYHPRANGGFSFGTQGTDFFRGGDLVNGLTGVLDFSDPAGAASPSWRVRPVAATPPTFTVANPRPATPPAVGGAIKVTGLNLLNYFTTIDTTASSSAGPCGPGGTLDCRGADSVAELNRQRERASVVICSLNADVAALIELENTTPSATITDLLGAINARCGGAHPYAFANTGGTLGTDAIRVQPIYRTGIVSPVGSPLSDLDPVHNRPPTAQTFDVVDATNAAFGQRFTVIANHLRAKSCSGATGGDADTGDGQSCFTAARTAQATRLLSWISSTVIPAAGDPDVLLLGDFNAYAQETPIATIVAGGYTDLETAFEGPAAYSYVFGGALGHLDYAFASASLNSQVIGASAWHINADEVPLLDYNDEVADVGESAFEEKPDGSALVPPRVVFQPASPYRASDHDPVLVGLFAVSDLAVTLTDSPDPVVAGNNLTYTITVSNNGPDAATAASWSLSLPPGRSFVSLPAVAGWTCTTPAVGSGGTVSCSNPGFSVGSGVFTLTAAVDPSIAAGTVLTATATVTSASGDPTPGNNSATATTTVGTSADLGVTNSAAPATAISGQAITYTITASNAGPSDAAGVSLSNPLPANTTFASLAAPGGWSCTTPAVGATGTVSCTAASLAVTSAVFTLVVTVDAGTTAANITDTATVSSATSDPNPGNESATATTPLSAEADLSVTHVATPLSGPDLAPGESIQYAMTVTNVGPSSAALVTLSNIMPPQTTLNSLTAPPGWSCTTPALGSNGTISCTRPTLAPGSSTITFVVLLDAGYLGSTVVDTASVTSATTDPAPGNETQTATTPVLASADLAVSNTASTPTAINGQPITYTVTVTNNGPSNAATVAMNNPIPANTTFTAATTPPGWNCTLPAAGGTGTVACANASLAPGSAVFSITVTVNPGAPVTMIVDTATVSSATGDPATGNESATATTSTPVSLQSFEVD
ncbi:putative repeat protein (TIGR01451 family) [Tahibacter aquaticus]|uniref:Putative repeat protein (TIGR01451 family) n=1 Tax=Tahibacter aquaticus TaxID=520092 RepID=A0A4R6YSH0_9GAMM|nr:ExeM/NucH family extracellular endonuclease [Tahibacter aquaticus]TDR41138.1 putative repeat protein (TIGR01451 family) [Tahibacter aquaticus]